MLNQLITIGVGLGVLFLAYLIDLVAALANVFGESTSDKFSWKKLGKGLAKALLWALSIVGITAELNLLAWFTTRLGFDTTSTLAGVDTVATLALIVGATISYIRNAFGNIKYFIENKTEVAKLDTEGVNPNYDKIADDAIAFADSITPDWLKGEQAISEDEKVEGEESEVLEELYYDSAEKAESHDGDTLTEEDLDAIYARLDETGEGLGSATPLSRRLKDGTWFGQAHPEGTLINLYDGGYKLVEELEVGDILISDTGRATRVVEKWQEESLPVYRIKTTQGSFDYTPEHPLLIKRPKLSDSQRHRRGYDSECYDIGYIPVQELQIGDLLVPNYEAQVEPTTGLSNEELQFFGYWLGDGYKDCADKYTTKFGFIADDKKREYLEGIMGDRISWCRHTNGRAWQGYLRLGDGIQDNSNRKKESLLRICLEQAGRYSYGKRIPFRLSLAEREQILKGYLKADGYCPDDKRTNSISTTSKELAYWVQETAWMLGRNSAISLRKMAGEQTNFGLRKHNLYEVSIGGEFNRHTEGGIKILGVEYLGEQDCWHIEVDGNHTYIAENIKVHNCSRYAYYLGTGIKMNYKPHPDYGPVNGRDMVNYLIKNYGFVKCGKEDGAIFSYDNSYYGHTGLVVSAKKNQVSDSNFVKPLYVGTHTLDLDKLKATYCKPKPAKTTATTTKTTSTTLKKGDKVKIIASGNARAGGKGSTSYGIGLTRYVLGINTKQKFPYKVGSKSGIVTGYYKKTSLKKV